MNEGKRSMGRSLLNLAKCEDVTYRHTIPGRIGLGV